MPAFNSFHTHASLRTFYVCFCILFHLVVPMHEHLGKHSGVIPISFSYTEWYLLFFLQCNYISNSVWKSRNTDALVNLYFSKLSRLTLQFMGHAQNYITCTQTFTLTKLVGCKHTTTFHETSEMNRDQMLKHLGQYSCYVNMSVIGNRGGRWTFRNWDDISLSPASRANTQTNSRQNTTLRRGAKPSAVLLKSGNIPNGSVPSSGSKSNKRRLTSLDLKAKVIRLRDGWKAQINAPWTAYYKIDQTEDELYQPTHTSPHTPPPPPTNRGNDELGRNTADLRVDHHLWGYWAFIEHPCFWH